MTKLPEITAASPARILVCDDAPSNCALVKACLECESVRVESVFSGEEVLPSVRRHPFDLILLDIELDGISGLEVARILRRELPPKIYLPIVILTARLDMETRIEGLGAGATDFITKPFDPAELSARVRNHVNTKRLHDRVLQINQALEDEQQKVVAVQQSLLPRALPAPPTVRFAAGYQPSNLASGDYYDVIVRANGRILIAIGDVSGHGIPSAMYMSILRATLHSEEKRGVELDAIIRRLNEVLYNGVDDYTFVTFYIAEWDPKRRVLRHISAGHTHPIVIDSETCGILPVEFAGSVPLSLEAEIDTQVYEISLSVGNRVLFYTDGIVEQASPTGEFFGVDGVLNSLLMTSGDTIEAATRELMQEVMRHAGTPKPSDDVTLLMMDVVG